MTRLTHAPIDPPAVQTPHHYHFAHIALRQHAKENPVGLFRVLWSGRRLEFVKDLWRQVCESCDSEGKASFDASDLRFQKKVLGKFPAVLIEMPKPHFTAEAYMIVLVLEKAIAELRRDEPLTMRYFTLELTHDPDSNDEKTMFCEWQSDGHSNYGAGPEATTRAMLERVAAML